MEELKEQMNEMSKKTQISTEEYDNLNKDMIDLKSKIEELQKEDFIRRIYYKS